MARLIIRGFWTLGHTLPWNAGSVPKSGTVGCATKAWHLDVALKHLAQVTLVNLFMFIGPIPPSTSSHLIIYSCAGQIISVSEQPECSVDSLQNIFKCIVNKNTVLFQVESIFCQGIIDCILGPLSKLLIEEDATQFWECCWGWEGTFCSQDPCLSFLVIVDSYKKGMVSTSTTRRPWSSLHCKDFRLNLLSLGDCHFGLLQRTNKVSLIDLNNPLTMIKMQVGCFLLRAVRAEFHAYLLTSAFLAVFLFSLLWLLCRCISSFLPLSSW